MSGLLYSLLVGAIGAIVVVSVTYLLVLLAAAALARRERRRAGQTAPAARTPPRIAVVIPAHNEELVLSSTLASLAAQEYPRDAFEVVVVADNCDDTTAQIARNSGATVLERVNPDDRGKGYALDWAFTQLLAQPTPAEAFVIVDADTWVAPDFLKIVADNLSRHSDGQGRAALQGRYGVLNPQEGWRAALMAAAFDLQNHVKPLGQDRLGCTVTLKGNGMAFTRPVLQQARWQGRSITEDMDYGLDLLQNQGIRVGYVPDALVRAQMPTTKDAATTQRERWEGGRYRLLRERAFPLLWQAVRQRDFRHCEAALFLMVPPLAELAALLLLWGILITVGYFCRILPDSKVWFTGLALAAAGYILYVIGGLRVADAPRTAYRALLQAPVYAAWKLVLYMSRSFRRGAGGNGAAQTEWVRTARAPVAPATAPDSARPPQGTEHSPS